MKNDVLRWYEKDEHLKALLSLMEDLNSDEQCEIATEIIIKASEFSDREYAKIVDEVGSFDPKDYKRWYDKNPSIHTAIEALRDLDESQRNTIINEFSQKILDYHYIELDEDVQ